MSACASANCTAPASLRQNDYLVCHLLLVPEVFIEPCSFCGRHSDLRISILYAGELLPQLYVMPNLSWVGCETLEARPSWLQLAGFSLSMLPGALFGCNLQFEANKHTAFQVCAQHF